MTGIQPGKFNRLIIVRQIDAGLLLDAGSTGNILLPRRYVPAHFNIGDTLDVFVYYDSEDQLIATTERPRIQINECAYLRVKDVNRAGAFLDWGLARDLLVPFAEQQQPMQVGRSYVVTLYRAADGRLAASSRLNRHLQETSQDFKLHQQVELLIWGVTDLGYKAVINNTHLGLVFRDDAFKPLRPGNRVTGYVKNIREDGKIDLSLQLPAALQRDELCERIVEHLLQQGGESTFTDRSPPDLIYWQFNVSKASYKKALGRLYKQRRIELFEDRIVLSDPPGSPEKKQG